MNKTLQTLLNDLGILQQPNIEEFLGFNLDNAKANIESINQEELIDLYYNDPIGYVEDVLGATIDKHQVDILNSVLHNKRTSVRSGQGVGKTAAVAWLVIWYLHMRYEAKVICTAPTSQQLSIVLWAEIAKWLFGSYAETVLEMTKTTVTRRGYEMNWFAQSKVAAKKENMLGLHADNMLIICDEAPGIKDEILEALLGTITGEDNKILLIGNPTRNTGIFFDSHNKLKENFKCIHINAEKVSRTDKTQHSMLKKKYGENSNIVRTLIRGEFPLEEDDVFFEYGLISSAMKKEIEDKSEDITGGKFTIIDIGCDVARFGGDNTCITFRIDNAGFIYKKYQGKDTMYTAGSLIRLAKQLHAKYPEAIIPIKIDDTGVGGGVTDRLKELKREQQLNWLVVVPVVFGVKIKHAYYDDSTTYMASILKDLLSEGFVLPDDEDLLGQLTTRKYYLTSTGKIRLESKKELKKRGLCSPDIGDSFFLTTLPFNRHKHFNK